MVAIPPRRLMAPLLLALLATGAPADPHPPPPPQLHVELDAPCHVPAMADWAPIVPFTGVPGSVYAPLDAVVALFPCEFQGLPRIAGGLGLRPPVLQLVFADPVEAVILIFIGATPERFAIDPPDIPVPAIPPGPSVVVDTVRCNWAPYDAYDAHDRTDLGPSCFFEIWVTDEVLVTGSATANLVATYADQQDPVFVWGTDVGIDDVSMQDQRLAVPIPVEPTSWGEIKSTFK